MSRPGITKNVTLSNDWQQLGKLYNDAYPTSLREGSTIANKVWLSFATNDAEVAFSDDQPAAGLTQGHPLGAGDSTVWENQGYIARAWVRNETAGSNAVMTITPIFES